MEIIKFSNIKIYYKNVLINDQKVDILQKLLKYLSISVTSFNQNIDNLPQTLKSLIIYSDIINIFEKL